MCSAVEANNIWIDLKKPLSNLWSHPRRVDDIQRQQQQQPNQPKRENNERKKRSHTMRIWLPFTTLAFYVYDIVFSRFSYDCKRPYKTMWSVFRTKPNNVVHTQIVFRASFSFLTEISPLLSVWFSFCLLPYFQPFFCFLREPNSFILNHSSNMFIP